MHSLVPTLVGVFAVVLTYGLAKTGYDRLTGASTNGN